jgi:hypothetical protein
MRLARMKIKEKIRLKYVWIHDDGKEKCMQLFDRETYWKMSFGKWER